MNRTPCPSIPRAYTLIEVLVVVALLAIVVSIASVSVAASDALADVLRTEGVWRENDQRGRLRARTEGQPALLSLSSDGRTLTLKLGSRMQCEGHTVDLRQCRAEFKCAAGSTPQIHIDRLGRSADYEACLRYNALSRRWRVSGLTGDMRQLEPQS